MSTCTEAPCSCTGKAGGLAQPRSWGDGEAEGRGCRPSVRARRVSTSDVRPQLGLQIVCRNCSRNKYPLKYLKDRMAKVCDGCYGELKKRGGDVPGPMRGNRGTTLPSFQVAYVASPWPVTGSLNPFPWRLRTKAALKEELGV